MEEIAREAPREIFVATQSSTERTTFTFNPLIASTLSTLSNKVTTEEPFTFHPLFPATLESSLTKTRIPTTLSSTPTSLVTSLPSFEPFVTTTKIIDAITSTSFNDITTGTAAYVTATPSNEIFSSQSTVASSTGIVTSFTPENTMNASTSTEKVFPSPQPHPSSDSKAIASTSKSINSNEAIGDDKVNAVDNSEGDSTTKSVPRTNDVGAVYTESVLNPQSTTTTDASLISEMVAGEGERSSERPTNSSYSDPKLEVGKTSQKPVTPTEKPLDPIDVTASYFDLPNNSRGASNSSRKPRLRSLFYYYFITANKLNESQSRETNKTLEEDHGQSEKSESFLGLPGDQSCVEHQTLLLASRSHLFQANSRNFMKSHFITP